MKSHLFFQKLSQWSSLEEYDRLVNSKGQTIRLVEDPLLGDNAPVIAICEELSLASKTDFYDVDDMIASHGEYEPYFDEEGCLQYGSSPEM
jgi:hypothetical protein